MYEGGVTVGVTVVALRKESVDRNFSVVSDSV